MTGPSVVADDASIGPSVVADDVDSLCSPILRSGTCAVDYVTITQVRV